MRFSNRLLLSSVAFTFVVSASLFSTPSAVAMDEENNELHARKKIKLEESSKSTDPTPLFQLFSEEGYWDSRDKVLSYLDSGLSYYSSSEDLKSLHMTNKVVNERINEYLRRFDKRGLENKVWVNGFTSGSLENLNFNAAVWYAYKHMVIAHQRIKEEDLNEDELKTVLQPLLNVVTYLQSGLKSDFKDCPEVVTHVSGFLNDAYVFLLNRPTQNFSLSKESKELMNLGKNQQNKTERELVRQFRFLTEAQYNPTQGIYADTEKNPSLMDPLGRHFWVMEKRKELNPYSLIMPDLMELDKENKKQWDLIHRYGVVLTQDSLRNAAYRYCRVGNSKREAELFEEVFKRDSNLKVFDLHNAVSANYKLGNFKREAELWEEILKRGYPDVYRLQKAARAHYDAKNFTRAAELFDEALKRDPNSIEDVFAKAITANYQVKNFTRLVELCEEVLKRDSTRPNNFRNAAAAHSLAKNFTREAELREEVLKRDPNPKVQDFESAAKAHYGAKNFTRSAQLWEEVLKRDPNPRIKDFTDALMVYKELGNKERCEELEYKIKELESSEKNPKLPNM